MRCALWILPIVCVRSAAGEEVDREPWDVNFEVHLDGLEGGDVETFSVRVHPEWAPIGAKHFKEIVESKILDGARFFRVLNGFVQFGIPGHPEDTEVWSHKKIPDDPVRKSNLYSTIAFANAGPSSRTTQMIINMGDNKHLDQSGYAPFAEVTHGMQTVFSIESQYGEGPDQGRILNEGNAYLKFKYPHMSYIKRITKATVGTSESKEM